MKYYAAALTMLLSVSPVVASAAATPAGLWEGTLSTPNGNLGFVFNLHQQGDNWAAEMDVPAQNVSELPLKDVKVEGNAVSFAIPGPGDPHFEGKLSEDGKTIAGNFNQGGASMKLDLKWKSDPRKASVVPANSGEVQVLEGVWEGALDVNGNVLHLRFKFVKSSDGGITGSIDSIDQGANDLPITTISRKGDTINLDVKIIGGGFEGTLDKDATTMKGTWSQGGGTLPLTLQRVKAEKKG